MFGFSAIIKRTARGVWNRQKRILLHSKFLGEIDAGPNVKGTLLNWIVYCLPSLLQMTRKMSS
jgi:hypothetical protein